MLLDSEQVSEGATWFSLSLSVNADVTGLTRRQEDSSPGKLRRQQLNMELQNRDLAYSKKCRFILKDVHYVMVAWGGKLPSTAALLHYKQLYT